MSSEIETAPIVLFVYNRLHTLKDTIKSLQKCNLASASDLIVFADGPKSEADAPDVQMVREYLCEIKGFRSTDLKLSKQNKGLAKSVIDGVSEVLQTFGKAIVIEDDLILSRNFLDYMNQCLIHYESFSEIFSISGFCLKIKRPSYNNFDSFIYGRAHSWGWATWQDRWKTVDWEIRDWEEVRRDRQAKKSFNHYGSDLFGMLESYMNGKNSSWYIRFNFAQFRQNRFTIYPFESKVINNGFGLQATHCRTYDRNVVVFDKGDKRVFLLDDNITVDPSLRRQLFKYKSIVYRATNRVLTSLMRLGILPQKQKTRHNELS